MAPGLPDRVDCARLANEGAVLERVFPLAEMPRLRDLLADPCGTVRASYAFATWEAGRWGALVRVESNPRLVCQRCMQGFEFAAAGASEVEFAPALDGADSPREVYATVDGQVSLHDLAEEELLLSLPYVAACTSPQTCGRAPLDLADEPMPDKVDDRTRPFAGLQDLLKKTR